MSVILNPVEQYFDLEGNPLQSGYLYFGEVYGNPVTQPVMVYFDPEFTIPASQPIRTVNGFPVRSGTATGIYAPDDVSILVQNQNKEQVIYIESSSINTNDTTTIYRESNVQLNADDNNRTFIALTSFTQTFEPSVNLGDRWRVTIINMSSGNIILDPNLSETIDGQATLQLQPNQALNVYSDGVNLKTTASVFPTTTIPSAATLDLRSVKPKLITVSGTNTITAVPMLGGDKITAVFSGACQLTQGANLQISGNANFTTEAGDILTFSSNGTITRVEISRFNGKAAAPPLNATNDPTFTSTSSTDPISPEWFHGGVKVDFNASGNAPLFACRAWVNFDGMLAGPIPPRASGNVSSITDNGTGDYTINFITAMQDANYACSGIATKSGAAGASIFISSGTAPTSSAVRILTYDSASGLIDVNQVHLTVFR